MMGQEERSRSLISESTAVAAPLPDDRQWDDFLAAKLASRREFIARQLARTPEERLAVIAKLARRVAALKPHR